MKNDGISRVEAVDAPAVIRPAAPGPEERVLDKGTPGAETGSGAKAPGKSAPSPASQQAAELLIGSKPLVDSEGPFDRYAKIRFDKATRSVVIQIISSGSGEVIREIPPGAWEKIGRGLLLSREKSAEEQR